MARIDEFLEHFAAIEKYLRRRTRQERNVSFYQLVEIGAQSESAVRRYREDLKEYADLRNAIVHERSDGHPIAEPNARAVRELGVIAGSLINPPRVYPAFAKEVVTVTPQDTVAEAVVVMRRHRYSQMPVRERGRIVDLLTTESLSDWLGKEAGHDLVSLADTTVSTVLEAAVTKTHYELASKNTTLFQVAEEFEEAERKGQRLSAVLITDSGKADQSLLGILTGHDLPKVFHLMKVH